MAELTVDLVTVDRLVWHGQATTVIAKTTDGDVGIMAGHTPVLSILADAPVTIRQVEGGTVRAAVHGGFLSMAGDRVEILGDLVELADEIDTSAVEHELREATAAGDTDAVRRAETRLRAAGHSD